MNVHAHPAPKRSTSESGSAPVAGGGQPPYDESMEKRIADLETIAIKSDERFAHIELRLDRIDDRLDRIDVRLDRIDARLDQTPTKEDFAKLQNEMLRGFVEAQKGHADTLKTVMSSILGLGGIGIAAMTLLTAYIVPKQSAVSALPQPPIVIQLPATGTVVPTAPSPAPPQRQP